MQIPPCVSLVLLTNSPSDSENCSSCKFLGVVCLGSLHSLVGDICIVLLLFGPTFLSLCGELVGECENVLLLNCLIALLQLLVG